MSRTSLITLIHIAKNDLQLDDETYRSVLRRTTGKVSCRDLTIPQLKTVIEALKNTGFKPVKTRRRRPDKASETSDKIRAVWRQMHVHGFISDAGEVALDHFVARITRQTNGGEGVATLAWLHDDSLVTVLESLKQWHIREIRKCFSERGEHIPVNPVTGRVVRSYDYVVSVYEQAYKRWQL
ncbi:TPA: regulatory protein GemA [Citrobacter freundii]|nr:regulatory protein GemA [Citrobacter freundii]